MRVRARTRSRRWILIALVAGASLVGLATGGDPARSTATACSWRVIATAKMPRDMAGVAALPSGDVWAVGPALYPENPHAPTIAHWDGRRLTLSHPLGSRADEERGLAAVAAISPNDVWAVGRDGDNPLILHWDGRRWRSVRTRPLSAWGALVDVVDLSPKNVWAVGYMGERQPLVMRWDGRRWTNSLGADQGQFYAVDATGPHDLWAVGDDFDDGRGIRVGSLALHWDGSGWSRVPTPNPYNPNYAGTEFQSSFDEIDARTATEAWAVHTNMAISDVQRWDGTSWQVSQIFLKKNLLAVAATSPRGVWAVGGVRHPQIVHFDGSRWTYAAPERIHRLRASLRAISAVSPRNIWAAGPRLLANYSC